MTNLGPLVLIWKHGTRVLTAGVGAGTMHVKKVRRRRNKLRIKGELKEKEEEERKGEGRRSQMRKKGRRRHLYAG